MSHALIYFDNAATTFPKPEEVYTAADKTFRQAGNPGRGGHQLALKSARLVYETREKTAEFLRAPRSERLIFSGGSTHSINSVLKGLSTPSRKGERAYLSEGDLVLVSALEHNAVMRPLKQLADACGIRVQSLPYVPGRIVDPDNLKKLIDADPPALVCITHASNVTGEVADVERIAAVSAAKNVPLLIDAAQTAGLLDIDLSMPGVTFWCASAHKSLMGQTGLGLLYIDPEWELEPLISGGTGSASEELIMPAVYPDRGEAGTLPTVAIATLAAGIEWITKVGTRAILEKENRLAERFLEKLRGKSLARIYGRDVKVHQIPNVAFSIDQVSCDRVADILDRDFNISLRPGLHCASAAHSTLGTLETGLLRASFGYFNTENEVDELIDALESIRSVARTA